MDDSKIKCMYFNERFAEKPQGKQCGWVQKSLVQTDITIKDLADALCHGASFKPGVLQGGRRAENWVQQQLFGLDFDDGIRIEEAYNKAITLGMTPCFIYTTFSHSEKHHKFRMIFCNDTVITDANTRDRLQAALMGAIGGIDEVYIKWRNMIQRCYYKKIHEYKPYYASCIVCEEWLNFANFEVWYKENYIDGKKFDLDKDILVQGNTEYAQDTCALISHYANTVFEARGIKSNIVENSQTGKFDTSMSLLGKRIEVGSFDTREIAMEKLLAHKTDYILRFARKSKKKVPDKVYQAMLNWKIEITDRYGSRGENTI